ncbi:hypothetical protein PCASD_22664 [Puccinia coronata f. sp. avenae]|uniref:Reverse transcriptase zinc-binding domain-containing protein n=1 Tax=Puccinia coronata f. sp. avenae TaxID=200324 RepID=A0A2N5TL71_9BASI|nr:hypothetical protein PCASD_22664 [Puccinia coronata f. sp. avenae]
MANTTTLIPPTICIVNIDMEERVHQSSIGHRTHTFRGMWGYLHLPNEKLIATLDPLELTLGAYHKAIEQVNSMELTPIMFLPTPAKEQFEIQVWKLQIAKVFRKQIATPIDETLAIPTLPPNVELISHLAPEIHMLKLMDASNNSAEGICQGIQGNEAADQTAKEATDRNANPDRKMKANLTKLHAALNAQLQQTSKKTLKARISDLPIADGSLINQLASEHSPLHHNLFKSKRRLDPSCPFCSGKETTRHLFDFCPQYRTARRTLLTQAKKKKIRCDWNQPHQLLKTPKAHAIVAAFLKSTGRFDYL